MNEQLLNLLDSVQRTARQVGDTAADAAYGVSKKTGELLSAAKLRIRIATLEGRVEGCFSEIGEMLYATHTGTPTDSELLLEKLREIDELKSQIAQLQQELEDLQGRAVQAACPNCGAVPGETDVFCRECGGKL